MATDIALAELATLAGERDNRTSIQTSLTVASLTATGLSGAVGATIAPAVLLVAPLLTACLGLLWLDHTVQIDKIGLYTRTTLHPILNMNSRSGSALLRWELEQDETNPERGPRWWRLDWPILAIFAVPGCVLGWTAARAITMTQLLWAAAALAALAQLAFILLWAKVCRSRPQRWRHMTRNKN